MKVLFTNPPWWEKCNKYTKNGCSKIFCLAGIRAGSRWPHTQPVRSTPDNFKFGDYTPYPFFMGYAATYVQQMTHADVIFRDSIAIKESYHSYFNYLEKKSFDYIVIESSTPSLDIDAKIISRIKKVTPHSKIVITGPIAVLGDELIDRFGCHAVLKGEYEKNVVKVINGQSGVIEMDLLTKSEMNNAPFPYFDETIAHRYKDNNPKGQKFPQLQMWTSRGCPFKCIFCVWPATMTGYDPDGSGKRLVRHYTADYIERFIKQMVAMYGFQSVYFDDDTFNLGDKHVKEICNVMANIGLPWSAMCRTDTINFDTWQYMKKSGCFGVKIGLESGNQYVVDKIVNKHLDLEYAKEVIYHLKKIGMTVHGTFTFGLPGETKDQIADTKKFISNMPFDTIQQSGCAEIDGTPLSTLTTEGKLTRYTGAKIDQDYDREKDGSVKWRRHIEAIKNGESTTTEDLE